MEHPACSTEFELELTAKKVVPRIAVRLKLWCYARLVKYMNEGVVFDFVRMLPHVVRIRIQDHYFPSVTAHFCLLHELVHIARCKPCPKMSFGWLPKKRCIVLQSNADCNT